MMTENNHLTLDDNIRFRRVGDEGVVVDLRSAEVMVISELGVRVLELIRETQSSQEVLAGITSEFEVSDEEARTDLHRFLESLRMRNMLRVNEADVSP